MAYPALPAISAPHVELRVVGPRGYTRRFIFLPERPYN